MYITIATYAVPIIVSIYLGVISSTSIEKPLELTTEPNTAIVEEVTEPKKQETEKEVTVESYIRQVFGDNAEDALRIAFCESSFRPEAQNKVSSAAGVFQITKGTWKDNSPYSWEDRYDFIKNIETAKIIFDKRGWQPWACK